MGRFSSFVAKAGDMMQQANDEYQRAKQEQQQHWQEQQQRGQEARYRGSPGVQQRMSGYAQPYIVSNGNPSGMGQQNLQQAVASPPPLPPRRPVASHEVRRGTEQSPTPMVSYEDGRESSRPSSVLPTHATASSQPVYTQAPQSGTQKLDNQHRKAVSGTQSLQEASEFREDMNQHATRETKDYVIPGAPRNPSHDWQGSKAPRSPHEAPDSLEVSADQGLSQQLQNLHVSKEQSNRSLPARLPSSQGQAEGSNTAPPSVSEPRYIAPSVEEETPRTPPISPNSPPKVPAKIPKSSVYGLVPVKSCINNRVCVNVDWFLHKDAPDFLVCSRCFVDHIQESSLRTSFEHKKFDDFRQVPRRCFFSADIVKKKLWRPAAATGSINGMLEHMKTRPRIAECPQQSSLSKHEWWTSPEIPGLVFCKACWTDEWQASSFAPHFQPETVEEPRTCGSTMAFVGRMYEMYGEVNNFADFAAEVKGRLTIPPCPQSKAIAPAAHAWMSSTRDPQGFQICYSCFADYFYGTSSAKHFQQIAVSEETTICLMGVLSMRMPAEQAVAKKDPELFWKWIAEVDKQPFCSKKGITGSNSWYTLPNKPAGFAVCGGCRAGLAVPTEWSHHLVPLDNIPPEATILCCFNAAHPRFAEFMACLAQSMATDTWEVLGNHAATFANVPSCPRDNTTMLANRRYWGWQSLRICEECYFSFAKDTALERLFHLRGEVFEQSRLCDLYSPRMRAAYTDACEGRSTGQALVDYAGQRRMVYIKTMPEIDRLISQQNIKASKAIMYGSMGTSYKSMGASLDVVMGHQYTVGNAYAGYGHANGLELTGAEYDRKGRDLAAEVSSGNVWHQVSLLERRWREVE